MKLSQNSSVNKVIIVIGLLFTASCGSSNSELSEGLNAGSNDGVTISNTATSPAQMKPGDIFQVALPAGQKGVIDMKGIPSGAEFDLAILNFSVAGGSSTVQMSNDLSELPFPSTETDAEELWEDAPAQEVLEEHLRGVELQLSTETPIRPAVTKSIGKSSVPALGSTEVFHVIGSIAKAGSATDVTARAVCITANTIFYVDVEVERRNPGDLTSRDIQTLCTNFEKALETEMRLFGEPSDVNGDGHVAILFTPQVNRLGSSQGGIITGFFYANDLYAARTSNMREMLYIMVPDSAGVYGAVIEKEFAMSNLIPAVLPHEMQHAISYNQHVFVGDGQPEEAWLNEGLSHLAEDLLGYGIENPSRYAIYLSRPEAYGLVTPGTPGLAARGGIFLFLRYLYEQHADRTQFVWNLLHSGKIGVANLEAAFASTDKEFDQYGEFLLRWSATLVLNNRGVSADPRFSYRSRETSPTGYLEGVCTVCDAGDNRETVLNGVRRASFSSAMGVSLSASAVEYYQLNAPPARINLMAPQGSAFGAVLVRTK